MFRVMQYIKKREVKIPFEEIRNSSNFQSFNEFGKKNTFHIYSKIHLWKYVILIEYYQRSFCKM